MRLLSVGKNTSTFDESKDVWGLGVTVLCFVFARDFSDYYDWAGSKVRLDKVGESVRAMAGLGYPLALVRAVGEALDANHITRVSIGRIREILRGGN